MTEQKTQNDCIFNDRRIIPAPLHTFVLFQQLCNLINSLLLQKIPSKKFYMPRCTLPTLAAAVLSTTQLPASNLDQKNRMRRRDKTCMDKKNALSRDTAVTMGAVYKCRLSTHYLVRSSSLLLTGLLIVIYRDREFHRPMTFSISSSSIQCSTASQASVTRLSSSFFSALEKSPIT